MSETVDRAAATGTVPAAPPSPNGRPASGPNPLLLIAAAFLAGVVVAKVIDWRSHAHPRL